MTPRLLGGKEVGSLARKVSKFQLDKNRDAYKIGVASASVAYPKSATEPRHSYALDMQMNVDIVRIGRGLGQLATDRRHHMGTAPFPFVPCEAPMWQAILATVR